MENTLTIDKLSEVQVRWLSNAITARIAAISDEGIPVKRGVPTAEGNDDLEELQTLAGILQNIDNLFVQR